MDISIRKVQLHMDKNEIELPLGAEILSTAVQKGHMVMWFLFDAIEKRTVLRTFHAKMTGVTFDSRKAEVFYGTLLLDMDNFVVHIFEEIT